MYEMWRAGVQTVIWQAIWDVPGDDSPGRGLYTTSDRPKLDLRAFAFPVVASARRNRGFVWGRAPTSRRVRVFIQRASGHSWKTIATARTGLDGVFYVRVRARRNGLYRARVARGPTSLAYDSKPIPPRRTRPFDTG
jgi:hypothetical protein